MGKVVVAGMGCVLVQSFGGAILNTQVLSHRFHFLEMSIMKLDLFNGDIFLLQKL